MTPQAFSAKSLEAITKHDSDYRPVAGETVIDPDQGYQAMLYLGHNGDMKRDFVLHVADTEPGSDAFEEVKVGWRQVDPNEGSMQVDGLELALFQGVGSLTLIEHHRSV